MVVKARNPSTELLVLFLNFLGLLTVATPEKKPVAELLLLDEAIWFGERFNYLLCRRYKLVNERRTTKDANFFHNDPLKLLICLRACDCADLIPTFRLITFRF